MCSNPCTTRGPAPLSLHLSLGATDAPVLIVGGAPEIGPLLGQRERRERREPAVREVLEVEVVLSTRTPVHPGRVHVVQGGGCTQPRYPPLCLHHPPPLSLRAAGAAEPQSWRNPARSRCFPRPAARPSPSVLLVLRGSAGAGEEVLLDLLSY